MKKLTITPKEAVQRLPNATLYNKETGAIDTETL